MFDDLPERLIGAEPASYLEWMLNHWAHKKDALAAVLAEYPRSFDAEGIRSTPEEFRAAATIDMIHAELLRFLLQRAMEQALSQFYLEL